jgi:hypothetical protein
MARFTISSRLNTSPADWDAGSETSKMYWKELLDLFFSGIRAVIKRKEFMRSQIHKIVSCGQTSICAPQSFVRPAHT